MRSLHVLFELRARTDISLLSPHRRLILWSSGEGGPHQHLDTNLLQNLPQLQTMPVAEADKAWCLATGVPMPLMVLESINSDAKSNNYD
jgi:hypothetical protein